MAVSWDEVLSAFEFTSLGAPYEHQAILCRGTGVFLLHSESGDEIDELPDEVDDSEQYVPLPHKTELGLGKPLVLAFAQEFLPASYDHIRQMFNRKGAYARFKDLLHQLNALDQWYDFEAKATERALRAWCALNDVAVTD